MENKEEKTLLRNNPFFVIGIASLVAIAMFTGSFMMYYRSDTKKTIEQIQANNLRETETTTEIPAELSPEYIDNLEKEITEKIESHNDETEFSPAELTDSALGL